MEECGAYEESERWIIMGEGYDSADGACSGCGSRALNITRHDLDGEFIVGKSVFGGKVNFFVRHTSSDNDKASVAMWEGHYTPHEHVSPDRTLWQHIIMFRYTFAMECETAHKIIQEWCDWANMQVEKSKMIEHQLDDQFGKG